jgi:hypothetical protein
VVFSVAMGVVIGTIAPPLAVLFVVVFLLMGIPVMLVSFALLSKRLDDNSGRYPMPGFYGLIGIDLTDDDYGRSGVSPEGRRVGVGRIPVGVDYDNMTLGGTAKREEPEIDAYGKPISHLYHCSYCGAPLPGPNAKFCSECGKPVVRTPLVENR